MAKSEDFQKLFDASQEVNREAFAAALRIADERGIDPQVLIRASFSQLQSVGFSFGLGGPPSGRGKPKPGPKPRARRRS